MKGLFIVLEGTDGAGHSTQAELLARYLRKKGRKVLFTREPTDSAIGGLIRSSLKHEWKTSNFALQLLFTADRAHHLAMEIGPVLKKGGIIICDRYALSTLAYASPDDIKFLMYMNSKFSRPDLVFLLDTPVSVCLDRIRHSRFHFELFEEKKKLENVRKNYMKLKNYFPSTHVIDGDESEEIIFENIRRIVDKLL